MRAPTSRSECTFRTSVHPKDFDSLCRDVDDSYMILSFIGETRVLGMNMEEELDEIELNGVDIVSTVWLNLNASSMRAHNFECECITRMSWYLICRLFIVPIWKLKPLLK
jgi:hypothetical protein